MLHELEVHQIELEIQNEELRRAQVALDAARATYFDLYDLAPVGYLTLSKNGLIGHANLTAARLLGVDRGRLLGRPLVRFFVPEDQQTYALCHERLFATERPQHCEARLATPAGAPPVWVQLDANLDRPTAGTAAGCRVTLTNITDRQQAEAAVRRLNEELEIRVQQRTDALAANETLLREVHHRVKNNLQMLCDLMYLQMEAMPDRDQHQDLQDAYSRIYAIARLHEQLYQSMQSGQIVLCEYLRRLADGFENLFPEVPVRVETAARGVMLDLDRAIHVGLVVNELITNAIKHAFPVGQPGEVTLSVGEADDQVHLQVRDTGRGLPADFDLEHAKTLGLRTVYLLTRRLEGAVQIGRDGGTSFTLTFPLHAEEPVEPK